MRHSHSLLSNKKSQDLNSNPRYLYKIHIIEVKNMTLDAVVERVLNSGNLLNNLGRIDVATWETSQEVFKAWQSGVPVNVVNTANLGVYRLEDDNVVFELFGREGNPFVDKTMREGVYNGIWQNEFFFPQRAMKDKIKSAKPLVTVRYSGLRLKTKDCITNYAYVEFDGKNTDEEKELFNAVYGTDNPGIGKRIYLLTKDVVEVQLKNKKNDLIARACFLDVNQNVYPIDRGTYFLSGAVRGVRLDSVAKGDKLQKDGIAPQETKPDYKDATRFINS